MNNYLENLKKRLDGSKRGKVFNLITFDSLPSTNDYLKENADNLPDFTVVVAQTQTAGKGRIGRKFHSLDGGVYMSILVRPSVETVGKITALTAVAVRDAIISVCKKTPLIKWVNDLYLDNKKVAGILCESKINGQKVDYTVVGIGVNVYEPTDGFSEEIKDIAGAIEPLKKQAREDLAEKISECFYEYFTGKEFSEIYRKNSYLSGKNLEISIGNEKIKGKFVEIDEEFRLVVETPNGIKKISSGEVLKVITSDKNC